MVEVLASDEVLWIERQRAAILFLRTLRQSELAVCVAEGGTDGRQNRRNEAPPPSTQCCGDDRRDRGSRDRTDNGAHVNPKATAREEEATSCNTGRRR